MLAEHHSFVFLELPLVIYVIANSYTDLRYLFDHSRTSSSSPVIPLLSLFLTLLQSLICYEDVAAGFR
ncbi:hypothetical protein O6P43_029749 [Quillaja saponaria]|uniref:Uncharacterized protein n=1 Tax=Quillaja saponaria TaxID=32244 RepID=A0AAD7L0Z1_QUISA|nr:hypothetical protein O6P43_029749 [Quillaja saponaria]